MYTNGHMVIFIGVCIHTFKCSGVFSFLSVRDLGSHGALELRRNPRAWVLISNTIPEEADSLEKLLSLDLKQKINEMSLEYCSASKWGSCKQTNK